MSARQIFESEDHMYTYIKKYYAVGDQNIEQINLLYYELSKQPDSVKEDLIKLFDVSDKSLNLNIAAQTYTISGTHKILYDVIMNTIKIPNGHESELWAAIVYGGEVSGAVAGEDGNITPDIRLFTGETISLKNYKKISGIDFGKLPPELAIQFRDMLSLFSFLFNIEVNVSIGRIAINNILKSMLNSKFENYLGALYDLEEINNEEDMTIVDQFIINVKEKLATFGVTDNLGSVKDLAEAFVNKIVEMAKAKLSKATYWTVINTSENIVYSKKSTDVIELLKPVDGLLPLGYANFKDLNLWINGNEILK